MMRVVTNLFLLCSIGQADVLRKADLDSGASEGMAQTTATTDEMIPAATRLGTRFASKAGNRLASQMGRQMGRQQGKTAAKFGKQTFNKGNMRNVKLNKPNNLGRGLMKPNNLLPSRFFRPQMRMPHMPRLPNFKPRGGFGGARNMLMTPVNHVKRYSRRFVDRINKLTKSGMDYLRRRFGKGVAEKVGLAGRLTIKTLKFGMYMWIALAFADAFRDVLDIVHYGYDCGRTVMVIAANMLTMPLGGVAQGLIWQVEETPLPAYIDPQQRGHEQFMKEGLRDFEHEIGEKIGQFMEKPEVKGWLDQTVAFLEPKVEMLGTILGSAPYEDDDLMTEFLRGASREAMQRTIDPAAVDRAMSRLDLSGDGKVDMEDFKTVFTAPVKYLVDTSTENDPNNDPDEMASLDDYMQMMKDDPLKVPGAFAADFFGAYLGPNEDLCDEEHGGGPGGAAPIETEFDGLELD